MGERTRHFDSALVALGLMEGAAVYPAFAESPQPTPTVQKENPGTGNAGGPWRSTPETGTSTGDSHGNVPGSPGKSCEHASDRGKEQGEPDPCNTPETRPTPPITITPGPSETVTVVPSQTVIPSATATEKPGIPTPTPTSIITAQPSKTPFVEVAKPEIPDVLPKAGEFGGASQALLGLALLSIGVGIALKKGHNRFKFIPWEK